MKSRFATLPFVLFAKHPDYRWFLLFLFPLPIIWVLLLPSGSVRSAADAERASSKLSKDNFYPLLNAWMIFFFYKCSCEISKGREALSHAWARNLSPGLGRTEIDFIHEQAQDRLATERKGKKNYPERNGEPIFLLFLGLFLLFQYFFRGCVSGALHVFWSISRFPLLLSF